MVSSFRLYDFLGNLGGQALLMIGLWLPRMLYNYPPKGWWIMLWIYTETRSVEVYSRDLQNNDDNGNGNVKKIIGLISKTTILHVHQPFCTFLLQSTTTTWNDQILRLLGNGNGKSINSTFPVQTWARSPLLSSSQNPLLLSNRVNWDNREKV